MAKLSAVKKALKKVKTKLKPIPGMGQVGIGKTKTNDVQGVMKAVHRQMKK